MFERIDTVALADIVGKSMAKVNVNETDTRVGVARILRDYSKEELFAIRWTFKAQTTLSNKSLSIRSIFIISTKRTRSLIDTFTNFYDSYTFVVKGNESPASYLQYVDLNTKKKTR